MDIKWQRGNFLKFFAKMKIRIGGKDSVDIIHEGDEFEYDGSICKYAGAEFPQPGLRGAIKNDWASLTEGDVTPVSAFVASRNVAKSQTVNKDLSRVQRTAVGVMDTDSLDEETVLEVSDRGKMEKASGGQTPRVLKSDDNRRTAMTMNTSTADSQEGITVGRVRSQAKMVADVTVKPNLASDIENRGLGRPHLDKSAMKKVLHTEGVTIRTSVGSVDSSVVEASDEGEIVGQVRHSARVSTEGIEVRDTSNIRNAGAKPKPVSQTIDTKLPPRIRMARRIDPSFPSNWIFTGKLKERMDAVKKHGESPVFLEALYAAEGDQMRRLMEKTYPKQFGER